MKNKDFVTLEMAKKIIEAFGPCSSVYECQDVAEVLEELEENGFLDGVAFMLEMEGIFWEREGIFDPTLCIEIEERLDTLMASIRQTAGWLKTKRKYVAEKSIGTRKGTKMYLPKKENERSDNYHLYE